MTANYVRHVQPSRAGASRSAGSRGLGIVLGASLLMLGTMVSQAEATHFRFGHNPWTRGSGNDVTFNFVQAWRIDFDDDLGIDFGDASFGLAPGVLIGTFSDLAGEQYLIESHTTPHTYANEGPFLAAGESCCRISTLVNAADNSYRIETTVDLRNGNQGSPVSSVPVIVQFPQGVVHTYTLPFADPDGDPVTCRLATQAESQITQIATAGGFDISVSSDCKVTWNTAGTAIGQKYAVQVMLEEDHEDNVGKVALDFIIEITDSLGNPPACSGVSGNHIVNVGQPFQANVTGTDADGGNLQIGHLGLPTGATLTPASGTTQAEPFNATFDWTPQAGDAGTAHAVTLFYTDPEGLQGTCAFSINVPSSVCGNGSVESPFEECDDGNTVNGDGCDANCQTEEALCGNETLDDGEQCDPPGSITCPAGSPAGAFLACNQDCSCPAPPECGDGVVNICPGPSAVGCTPEECDDGNTVSGDGCSSTCTNEPATCGDGEINQPSEECDPPGSITCPGGSPAGAFLACNSDCTCPTCGDGTVGPGEECDDSNTANGDGCSSTCELEEICNDFVDNNDDGLIDCQDPVACDCGDVGQQRPHLVAASIFFDGPQDRLKINSNVKPTTPIDPVNEIVGFVLSNANGVVLTGQLPAGSLKKHGKSFLFKNTQARKLGGIGQVKIVTRNGGNFRLTIIAYGDLSPATLPNMTLQLTIGNDSFVNISNWTPSSHGFVLKIP